MCLDSVRETYDPPSSLILGGEKSFHGSAQKPTFSVYSLHGSRDVPLDQWITADISQKVRANDGKDYESGFHVVEEIKMTLLAAVSRRVFVRYVSARGEQNHETVWVAREMYVPSDPNGWPPKPGEEPKQPKPDEDPKKESLLNKAKGLFRAGSA